MSNDTVTPAGAKSRSTRIDPRTTRLLTCGALAGPLFIAVWALQAFNRKGFDPTRHPMSLLSLGDLGWIQVANFVLTGVLFVAFSVGLRHVLHPGRAGTWGPRLVGVTGAGLITAGVFLTDAGAGFPAGAPAGAPEMMTWHGAVHELGYVVVMLSWTAACFVLRRRFRMAGESALARLCVASVVAVIVVSAVPHLESFTIRIVVATAIQFGLLAVVAARLRRGAPQV